MRTRPRHAATGMAVALMFVAAACESENATQAIDPMAAPTTLLDISATTQGPPTTPVPTAYPTIPVVTAVAPYWAPTSWSVDQVRSYLALVEESLGDLGAEHTVDGNNGVATLDNGTPIDLTLLAARLTLLPASQWKGTIDAYLASELSPDQSEQDLTYEAALPLLRVKLGTLASLGLGIDQGVVQPIVDDLVLAVVVERETGIAFLAPSQLGTWRRTFDQVVTAAIEQTLARGVTPGRDGPFTTLTDDPFASARLLDPTVVMNTNSANGYVIAIPSVDQFIAIEAGPKLTPSTIQAFVEQVADDFSNRNNPASPDLYWWRNGIVVTLRQQGDSVAIPEDLQLLINPPDQG